MKLLGIDYGTKRIGVAISDDLGMLAFPLEMVPNDKNKFKRLKEIIVSENIAEIVIGESVDFSGRLNALALRIEDFITELKNNFDLPIRSQKEFLTTVEARKSADGKRDLSPSQAHSKLKDKKRGSVDASAAALILQRYLDKNNKQK